MYEGISAYEKASHLFTVHALTDFDIIEYCLKPLGNNYSMLGDYTSAANIVKGYLYLAGQQGNDEQRISAYINLSIIYHDTGQYQQAIQLLQQALTMSPVPAEKKMLMYYNLARNYVDLRELAKARRYVNLAASIYQQHLRSDALPTLVHVYTLHAAISLAEGQPTNALTWIEKAQTLAVSNAPLFKNRELAKLVNTHAGILMIGGRDHEAILRYHQALTWLIPQYDPMKNELPDAAAFYAENAIKETLDGMAEAYAKLNDPVKSLACYKLWFKAEDLLRDTYNYEEAKLTQQAENRNVTEKALELLYGLLEKTKDSRYAIEAFQFAERTKAVTLRESSEDRYWRQRQEQDTLVKTQNQLRYKQAMLASEIVTEQLKQGQADVVYIHQRIAQQTTNAVALKEIAQALEEKYPQRKLTDSFQPQVMRNLQRRLQTDRATVVEFFFGTRALYIFRVDQHSVQMSKVDASEMLKQNVLALRDFFANASAINNQIEQYKGLAFEIARALHLVEPFATSNIILVPDGVLSLIPFDALLYEKASGVTYENFPWLLRRYTIAYQPSALIYANAVSPPVALDKKSLLGVFPVFHNSALQLDYSIKEAGDIQNQTDGLFLFNEAATQQAFLKQAGQFRIIHLSTHASSGIDAAPPSIMFSDSTLYLPRIYGLNLKADLLVLSACETGVGVLVKGEGAISLAHGFQFSGIRNAIFSLWKVNDYSTAVLMGNFYRQYFASGNKAESLRLARQDYLNDETIDNTRKSPYYWAGFVYYGSLETQPVDTAFSQLLFLSLAAVLLSIFAIIYVLYKRRHKVGA
ncbi:CHAT domain-containing protein [Dawidia soli]|uniref:CHAT domain-containing protein n=1 Tax=Dawidia soli TaxID=2782352 RepID=A0AAP2D7R2_9BACT|nr:CHAT domain-containing protein [Dawidia soli]MBT1686156.1 CHAT domain-containing protein [Dawidia soli]